MVKAVRQVRLLPDLIPIILPDTTKIKKEVAQSCLSLNNLHAETQETVTHVKGVASRFGRTILTTS